MTPSQKIVSAAVVVAAAAGLTLVVVNQQTAPPPPGYWQEGVWNIPCSTVQPYLEFDDPVQLKKGYLRYDAKATGVSPQPDGKAAGQGGAMHTIQYYLDGHLVPLRSGQPYPGEPHDTPPALYRDADLEYPGTELKTLCDKYRDLNGPEAQTCPSGVTIQVYSNKVTGMDEWQAGWNVTRPRWQQYCSGPQPTRTPTPAGPTRTPTPGGVPTPAVTCLPCRPWGT